MKRFNLVDAKAGKSVRTKSGHAVNILWFNIDIEGFPILGEYRTKGKYVTEHYSLKGVAYSNDHSLDLCMASTLKRGWVNVYPNYEISRTTYPSRHECVKAARPDCIATARLNWEE